MIKTVEWTDEGVRMLDQRLLPTEEKYLILRSYEALISEAERSSAFRKTLLRMASDSGRKRSRLYKASPTAPPSTKALETLRRDILAFNESVSVQANATSVADPRATAPAEAS